MASHIRRRKFLATLGGAGAWPLAASAQQPVVLVIGILAVAAPEANAIRLRAFREGLRTAGYIEGQNVKIEYRWAEAHTGRLPELAAGLVRDRVAVLVAAGGTACGGQSGDQRRVRRRVIGSTVRRQHRGKCDPSTRLSRGPTYRGLYRGPERQDRTAEQRDELAPFGGAAATWPLATRAQQNQGTPHIGVLQPPGAS